MNHDEKQAFANEAEKALDHPLVIEVMEELCFNLRVPFDGLPRYGLRKVALYVATVARAHALGIDPDTLRMTDDEATDFQMDLARTAVEAGQPVFIAVVADDER